jgi:apolipoprotein N-acyltransferase
LARRLGGLAGWRRLAAALVLGALAVLALPPFFVLPVLFISYTGLVWLIDGSAKGPGAWHRVLAVGWCFGFAHFTVGLYWITNALLVDAATHGWLAPFAVAGLSLYFAIFPALACLAATWAPPGAWRVAALAAAWALAEWARGVALTGFSWNLVSTALAFDGSALQGAALLGGYGLSLVLVAIAAAPALLSRAATGRIAHWPLTGVAGLALALAGGGLIRVAMAPDPDAASTQVKLRIIQGNIPQRLKWRRELANQHFLTYLNLSRAPGAGAPDVVIWPETALPFSLNGDPQRIALLKRAVPPDGVLITGAVRTNPPVPGPRRIWNTVVAVTGGGVAATYDKHHLVPFGEYVPGRGLLPIAKITAGRLDFSAGPGPATVSVPGLPPFSPLVCYEATFPGAVTGPGLRPAWLLNLTNDGWFGRSTGPYQHLAAARMRAVEEGLPLVRAANTGISAVIDPWGRILARLPLDRRGVIERPLPAGLESPTPYARIGNWILVVIAALIGAGAALARRRRHGAIS